MLEKTEEGGGIFYASDFEQNLPPLPSAAFSVMVPGAAFPEWKNHKPPAMSRVCRESQTNRT